MMHTPSEMSYGQGVSGASSLYAEDAQGTSPAARSKADTPRFLITLDGGIGDTVLAGLSAIDQIIKNDPAAYGKIDIRGAREPRWLPQRASHPTHPGEPCRSLCKVAVRYDMINF